MTKKIVKKLIQPMPNKNEVTMNLQEMKQREILMKKERQAVRLKRS